MDSRDAFASETDLSIHSFFFFLLGDVIVIKIQKI